LEFQATGLDFGLNKEIELKTLKQHHESDFFHWRLSLRSHSSAYFYRISDSSSTD
jgi:hypothetical protein